ncbi:MAG: hypothetical protein IEMM0006_2191 [bacterium]|nr:MAG: hypothetical protein IEMM0006_2191 [bacterium]
MKSHFNTRRITRILLLASFFILAGTQLTYAQNIPPAIQAQIDAELQRRGLNEADVQARLLKEGIDFQNIPKAKWPQYQNKVLAILDKMQAEKKAAVNLADTTTITPKVVVTARQGTILAPSLLQEPVTTSAEAVASAAQRVIHVIADSSKGSHQIYGHSLIYE